MSTSSGIAHNPTRSAHAPNPLDAVHTANGIAKQSPVIIGMAQGKMVKVDNLVGSSEQNATAALKASGFQPVTQFVDAEEGDAPGTVLRQSPAGGAFLENFVATPEHARFALASAGIVPVVNIGLGLKVASALFLVFAALAAFDVVRPGRGRHEGDAP